MIIRKRILKSIILPSKIGQLLPSIQQKNKKKLKYMKHFNYSTAIKNANIKQLENHTEKELREEFP